MNAAPESTQSSHAPSVTIALDVEIADSAHVEVDLRFNGSGEVEAPGASGTWIVVGVVNIIVYDRGNTIEAVTLNLDPANEHDMLGKDLTTITQDGYVNESNVAWTYNNAGQNFLRFLVPRSGCDRNPRTFDFSGNPVAPAPLKVKVRITRIDSQRLDLSDQ